MKIKWSKRETEILKNLYPKFLIGLITIEDIQSVLVNRTKDAIKHQASRLGIKSQGGYVDEKRYQELLKRIKI